jgi:hypothetical protein
MNWHLCQFRKQRGSLSLSTIVGCDLFERQISNAPSRRLSELEGPSQSVARRLGAVDVPAMYSATIERIDRDQLRDG